MPSPAQIAEKFKALDIHDDTVEGFRFVPAVKRETKAKVEITLYRHWKNKRRVLTFNNCANFQVTLDADVLLGNSPNNACVADASADRNDIATLMRQHKRNWHLSYQRSIDPLQAKLIAAEKYVLFRLHMFGGVLLIVARTFSSRRISPKSEAVT